jgi:hypothetical protein
MSAGDGRKSAKKLQEWLRAGIYRIGAVRRLPAGDETIEVWSALDALVLKATALVLTGHWLRKLSPHYDRIEGRGGAKAAGRFVDAHRADNPVVFRTGRAAGRQDWDGVDRRRESKFP